jgi:hypothetical protein
MCGWPPDHFGLDGLAVAKQTIATFIEKASWRKQSARLTFGLLDFVALRPQPWMSLNSQKG